MSSYFDIKVSVYHGIRDNKGVVCPLRNFLFSKRHKDEIVYIRSLYGTDDYKKKKKNLPMAAISGRFSTRHISGLIEHTGLICIDIDKSDNPHLDMDKDVKTYLTSLPYVFYVGKSVSGKGYFAIIPLLHKGLHRQHFESLKYELSEHGINIDKGCGDVTRTRFLSYDENPYINEDAMLYDGIRSEADNRPKAVYAATPISRPSVPQGTGLTDEQKIEMCIQLIEQRHIDITEGYANWTSLGASLASIGEQGRNFFHRISRMNSEYKFEISDRKFSNVMRTMHSFSLGYFFDICYRNGITFKEALRNSRAFV